MRLVTIGCEYVGKTTLADALQAWGAENGREFHMATATSASRTTATSREDEQMALVEAPPGLKERFQRMQIYYHIFVQSNCEDCIFGGYHIQEAIYAPATTTRHRGPLREAGRGLPAAGHDPGVDDGRPRRDQGEDEGCAAQVPHRAPEDVEEIQAEFETEFTGRPSSARCASIRPASHPRRYWTGSSPPSGPP